MCIHIFFSFDISKSGISEGTPGFPFFKDVASCLPSRLNGSFRIFFSSWLLLGYISWHLQSWHKSHVIKSLFLVNSIQSNVLWLTPRLSSESSSASRHITLYSYINILPGNGFWHNTPIIVVDLIWSWCSFLSIPNNSPLER